MNQQNTSKKPSLSTSDLPVKRKRGRPRKDENMSRNEKRHAPASISPSQPPPTMSAITTIQPPPTVTLNPIGDNHNMVGQMVTGVIDGVFDAGYLLSIRVGPNTNLLRGLVFQKGHFCPITPTNDVVPHLKMSRRETLQIPISNQTQLCNSIPQGACPKQAQQIGIPVKMQNYQTTHMMQGGSSNSTTPPENLRMVEQDELMQVFEVSKMVEEQKKNDDCGGHVLKNDHLVSDYDLMAESLPTNDVMKDPRLHCGAPLVQDIDHESLINEAYKQKQVGEIAEPITRIETGVEKGPTNEKDILQQESEKQEDEMNMIDVNQDQNQGVAIDLFETD